MSANPQQAREIFVAAVKMAPDEQDAFVDEACGAKEELRRRVRNLLLAHRKAGDCLEPSAADTEATCLAATIERPGSIVGSYKLLEQIGEGGFGVVFMAEQTHPVRRTVALKVLKPGMDSRQIIARFEAERQVLALMDHPNIAKVLDAGETTTRRPFFVMELVRGIPVTDFCDQNGLDVPERLELFASVCQAVQHAHQKGVIHRDLKPSNVLVTRHDGVPVPKVIDFGIAKATGASLTDKTLFTGFAQMVGTPLYMSPEQIEMNGLDLDTRTDVYALGVLLYEMLTGTTPFAEERLRQAGFDKIRRIIREEEPPRPSARLGMLGQALDAVSARRKTDPRRLGRQLRGELDWIVMKCLEKNRTRRYDSAGALAADVRHHLRDEPISAGPPSARYRFGKFARRHRVALTTVSLVVLALVTGTTISTWQAIRATRAEDLAGKRLEAAQGGESRAIRAEREARQRLFEARLAQIRARRLSRQAGQRFESLEAVTEAARLARELELGGERLRELYDEAIACLALADVQLTKDWSNPPGSSSGVAFDANLERYARSDVAGTISVRSVEGDRELAALTGGGAGAANMNFSPDGILLAVESWGLLPERPTNFQLWDWQKQQCVFEPSFPVQTFNFSPDGRYLALGERIQALTLYDVVTREAKRIPLDFPPSQLVFNPNGSKFAVASSGGKIQVREVGTGKLLREMPGQSFIRQLAWHPDGVLLAAAYDDSNLCLWDTTTAQPHAVLRGHQANVVRVAFSPDGDTLMSSAWDGSSRLWDPWTGRELVRFLGEARCFSRDGRRLASVTDPRLAMWDVVLAREYRSLPKSQPTAREVVSGGDISPDGRWLAIAGGNRVRIVDLALRKERASLPGRFAVDAKFHPSGKELFTSGRVGLYRWSVDTQTGSLRIGPARRLPVSGWLERMSLDREGRTLAIIHSGTNGGRIVDLDSPPGNGLVFHHVNAVTVTQSPNRRWVAAGTQHDYGVNVWEVHSGRVLHLVPEERDTTVAFSPDSQQFVIGLKSEYQVWDTTRWEVTHRIPREGGGHFGQMSFTRDGRVLAVLTAPGRVQLVDSTNGRSFTVLQMPNTEPIHWLGFTPDGGQLLVGAGMHGQVHVWDLRLVGRQLQDLGLNWDLPREAPPTSPRDTTLLKVEVQLGEFGPGVQAYDQFMNGIAHYQAKEWSEAVAVFSQVIALLPDHACAWHYRGLAHCRLGKWDKARADLSKATELDKDNPLLLNNLAWVLVTCPELHLRDTPRALRLAERAVQLAPKKGGHWNTLGVARHRAGNWQAAIEALEKSMSLRKGGDGWNFFFLAMAHWQLKQEDQAHRWYARAVEWMDKHDPNDEELHRFQSEAAELLGITEPKH